MSIDPTDIESADAIIAMALEEDLRDRGDLTSQATIPSSQRAEVRIVAREAGILSGVVLVDRVYRALVARDAHNGGSTTEPVSTNFLLADGDELLPGNHIASIAGPVRVLLSGERIVLNFLIHLSGIATRTGDFVRRAAGSRAVILDTRKTLPGYRALQKYAVRCGGGINHRMGLFDGILIKDNHLAAQQDQSAAKCVQTACEYLDQRSLSLPVEVEVTTLEQFRDCLNASPEIVLLDNMRPAELQRAVGLRDELAPDTLLEASGGVTLENVACIAGTGVDRISIGELTHSAPALDIGCDWPDLS